MKAVRRFRLFREVETSCGARLLFCPCVMLLNMPWRWLHFLRHWSSCRPMPVVCWGAVLPWYYCCGVGFRGLTLEVGFLRWSACSLLISCCRRAAVPWFLLIQALEQFSTDAADTENDPAKESIFDEKVSYCCTVLYTAVSIS